MSGKGTWQYKIFFQNQNGIIKWIKVNKTIDNVVGELYRRDMISEGLKDAAEIFGPQVDHTKRIRPIIDAMLSKIDLNVKKYDAFREVMLSETVKADKDELEGYLPKEKPEPWPEAKN